MRINFHPSLVPYQLIPGATRKAPKRLKLQWFQGDHDKLEEIIKYYESKLNQQRKHVLEELIEKIEAYYAKPYMKAAIQEALALYYPFRPHDPLAQYYPLHGKYNPLIKSPSELRIEYFSTATSYSPPTKHREALTPLAELLGKSVNQVKASLYSSYKPNFTLQKRGTPQPATLAGHINFAYVTALAKLAQEITILLRTKRVPAQILKRSIVAGRRLNVWVEIQQTKEQYLQLTIQELDETLTTTKEINARIAQLFEIIFHEIIYHETPFTIHMDVKPNKRTLSSLTLKNEDLKGTHIKEAIVEISPEKIEFDSRLEEEFYQYLKREHLLWEIHPQQVVIHEGIIYIPDFVARSKQEGTEVLIEIAGYYTETYLKKKRQKLEILCKDHHIIIVTPETQQHWFKGMNASIVTYKDNHPLPWQRIIHLLNTKYLPKTTSNRVTQYLASHQDQQFIPVRTLIEGLHTSRTNLHEVLQDKEVQDKLQEEGFRYLPQVGLIKVTVIRDIQKELLTSYPKGVLFLEDAVKKIKKYLPELDSEQTSKLLSELGARLEYKDLFSVRINIQAWMEED